MKRIVLLGAAVLLVLALVLPAAFGWSGEGREDRTESFFGPMFEQHRNWVDRAEQSGRMDAEQARTWRNHFDEMERFHRENGFCHDLDGEGAGMMSGMMSGRSGMMSSSR